ncbi:MAG: fasciclin domain-containing protein, partial [Muribaculaceae bacterium]|nr:fasciclin domain-containing protein [Muribaculaceae bacterium]
WYGIGDIADEDSLFTMIIPDNNAWEKAYERIRPYYNVYDKDQAVADSIGDVQTKLAIVNDLVFRRVIENPAAETDLWSTRGSQVVDPMELFGGTMGKNASNGMMYLASQLNYDNVATWNKLLEVEGENQEGRQAAQASTIYTRSVGAENIHSDSISENRYIEVVSSGSTATQPGVTITIPNVLSTEYDIYVSFVPGTVTDTLNIEKTRLTFTLSYMGANGRTVNKTFRDQKSDRYVTSDREMTWMKVNDEPMEFPVSNYYDMLWLIDPLHTQNDRVNTTKLLIKTDVTNTEFNRNEMVRRFRIDRVVFVPIKK